MAGDGQKTTRRVRKGGPKGYTVKDYEKAIRKANGVLTKAAEILGVTLPTMSITVKKHPELQRAREEAKSRIVDEAENQLYRLVQEGDKTAIIFVLKTMGKDRGFTERKEHTGEDGGPIRLCWEDEE